MEVNRDIAYATAWLLGEGRIQGHGLGQDAYKLYVRLREIVEGEVGSDFFKYLEPYTGSGIRTYDLNIGMFAHQLRPRMHANPNFARRCWEEVLQYHGVSMFMDGPVVNPLDSGAQAQPVSRPSAAAHATDDISNGKRALIALAFIGGLALIIVCMVALA